MKLKYYLRGIGIGVIVTTIILMITFAIRREPPLSDEEIMERAAALGMVMQEKQTDNDKLSDLPSPSQKEDDQNEADHSKEDETDEPQTDGADVKKNESDDQTASEPVKNENEPKKETIEQTEIVIAGGEYSDDVCKKLKKAGIIDDAKDFNEYLAQGGYDNMIQPGNYVIPLDADYEEIVRLLTEKKEKH